MYSFYPSTGYSSARHYHQHHPNFTYVPSISTPTIVPVTSNFHDDLNDSSDEEEILLRAALARKQRERLARQQYRQQQLEQQLLLEQQQRAEQQRYEALLLRERARQHAIAQAQAQAQAQREAEQEALWRFQRAQLIKEKQQRQQNAVLQTLIHGGLQAQHERTKAVERSQAAARPFLKVTVDSDDEDVNPLEALFEALLVPQQKRVQPQEERYPCKRRIHGSFEKQKQQQQQQQAKKQETSMKEQIAKANEQKQAAKKEVPQKEVYDALPVIFSVLEAVLGASGESGNSNQARCVPSNSSSCQAKSGEKCKASGPVKKPTESNASSSSPELKATEILRQRQQRQQEQAFNLQKKHSELNLIDSALDGFSRDLWDALESDTTEETKKAILSTEDSVSKAMFQIDSVQSDGDLSIRKRRKELIKKSQDMLDLVDKYRTLGTNTGKKVVRDSDYDSDSDSSSNTDSEQLNLEVEEKSKEPADRVDLLVEAESTENQENEAEVDEENVEPYHVEVTKGTRSVTVEDSNDEEDDNGEDSQQSIEPSITSAEKVVESTDIINDEEEKEEEEAKEEESRKVETSQAATESHDDYELISDY